MAVLNHHIVGHLLEIIIRPYGSGGTEATNPHPLVAPRIDTRIDRSPFVE